MRKYKVALDDGHGMSTSGKRTPAIPSLGGRVIKENEFNWAVVKELDQLLRKNGNFETIFTAPTDADPSLGTRCRIANEFKADIFVSVHANASDGKFDGDAKDASGIETWYYSTSGKKLAEMIQKELIKGTRQKNRGIKKGGFYVLKYTNMPAVLTENLFMDNEREAALMIDKDYITEVAREHYVGICEYFGVSSKESDNKPSIAGPNSNTIKYRVRKSVNDAKSQKGAFNILNNAKKCANAHKGYSVYDENGKLVYPTKQEKELVIITADILNVRKGPSTAYRIAKRVKKNQVYTIVEKKGNWGKLKSGAGWINLKYTKKK